MKISLFGLLRQFCGLSHGEVSEVFNVSLDTAKSWSSDRRTAPPAVMNEIAYLAERIDTAADEVADFVVEDDESVIELGLCADDAEAQSQGWPCLGASHAAIGMTAARLIAEGHVVRIVPRGTTLASAAAADIHDKHR